MTVHTFLWFHLEEFYVFTSSDSGIENWTIVYVGIKESIIASGKVIGRKNTLYYE